ncbi:MAG: hypothetical protein ACP5GI_01780 [Sulfolobales archaeon]
MTSIAWLAIHILPLHTLIWFFTALYGSATAKSGSESSSTNLCKNVFDGLSIFFIII